MAEQEKNNFLLPNRLDAVVAKLSDKQAGVLFKCILAYANKRAIDTFEDGMVSVVFEMARQEIDYNTEKYANRCYQNALNGKLGGAPKGNCNAKKQPNACLNNRTVKKTTENKQKQPKTSKTTLYDNDVDVDVDNDIKQQLLTADLAAGKALSKPKKLNDLQKFSNAVIENFEQNVQTPEQKRIWFRRNCRCLTDILNYCGKNIPLALGTIEACAARLQKANLSGGYEAVCRNLPEYMGQAQKDEMEVKYASYAETRETAGNPA